MSSPKDAPPSSDVEAPHLSASASDSPPAPALGKIITASTDDGYTLKRARTDGGHYVDTSQPAFPVYHRKFASPAPLGLLAFSSCTFIVSMFNVSARHIKHPGFIVAPALGTGACGQVVAGIWEFASGNTFAATSFIMYGTFWISFSIAQIPFFHIEAAVPPDELASSIGIWAASWFIITFILFLATLRSSIALSLILFWLLPTFAMLMGFYFTGNTAYQTASGVFGIITSIVGFYTAAAALIDGTNSYFVLPVGDLTPGSKLAQRLH